ncbi:MAG TPA: lytic transglycosylase domain-containing protein [Desulfatiglandales bacterium]|nr:lytic transglycosylase domain-containing protein [Desulfatiglandales bacterium]
MRKLLPSCLLLLLFTHPCFAASDTRTVEIPLTFDFLLVRSMLKDALYTSPGGKVLLEDQDGCTSIELWDPKVFPAGTSLGIKSKMKFETGFRIGSTCFHLLTWAGEIEILQRLRLDKENWQLRFETEDSFIYDRNHKRPFFAGMFWAHVKPYFHSNMDKMKIDLSSAARELRNLLPLFFSEEQRPQVESWLGTLRPGEVTIGPDAVESKLMMDVTVSPATDSAPEVTQSELERLTRDWETWDAFFVYEIQSLINQPLEQWERDEILDTLLSMRYTFTQALAEDSLTRDLISRQFTDSWDRVSKILRKYLRHETFPSLLRHIAFFTAADALAVVEKLGPAIGMEMTPEGLRRLASLFGEEGRETDLGYTYEVDPRLRELLGLGPPLSESGPSFDGEGFESPERSEEETPSHNDSLWPRSLFRLASARARTPAIPPEVREWIPPESEADWPQYLSKVHEILKAAAEERISKNPQNSKYQSPYRVLVLATAWQESCWRQLVRKRGKVTYLLSYNRTSVGLMQINERVWRGLYQRESLRWNIRYNARAGAEILDLYMRDYAISQMQAQGLTDDALLARAVYSMYNAGPGALQRFMKRYRRNAPDYLDRLFKEKYELTQNAKFDEIAVCLIGSSV